MVEFRVLGDVEALVDGRLVELGHTRQRTVLVALLVDAGRAVPTERIVDRVWGEDPPLRSRESLYSYLSRLRRVLSDVPGVALRRGPGGYVLAVAPASVDLHRFRELTGRARGTDDPGRALELLDEAIGLWRGDAFTGLDTDWTDGLRQELERERLAAELARNDLLLRRGGHAALLPELSARSAAHPLDERLAGQLMLALYRSGRQADALRQFQETRSRLVDELGLEPGPRLQEVHQEILAGDASGGFTPPAAVAAPAVPAQLPAEVPGFTGREAELDELDRLLEPPRPGGPATVRVAVLSGTAGAGKTTLALRWAHRRRTGFGDGQLYVNLRGYDPDEPMAAADALAGFLRALGMPGAQIPAGLDELSAAYRSLVDGRRIVVVLDNAVSAEQARPLLPGTPTAAVLVTSRDSLVGLVVRDGARRVAVDRLPLDESVRLLESLIGPRAVAEPGPTATLARRCARLPLTLRVAAELAAARPAVGLVTLVAELADEQQRLAMLDATGDDRTAVRAVFSWSYHQLADDTARAFRLMGLHPGPDLEPYAAAALTGTGPDTARDLLGRLARVHLLRETAPGRYEMHDLLRAYAVQRGTDIDTGDDRHRALTRLLDFYLRTAGSAMDALVPAETRRRPTVERAWTSGPPVDEPAAARAWLDSEREVLVAACAHAAAHGLPGHAADLAGTLGRYLELGGHYAEALSVHGHARDAARRTGDLAGEARALDNLGLVHRWQDHYPEAAREHGRAVALFHEAGDRTGEAYALGNLGIVAWQQGHYDEAAEQQLRALELFREAGDRTGEVRTASALGFVRRRQGRYREAVDHHRSALGLFTDLSDPIGRSYTLAGLGLALSRLGHDEQAVADHLRSLELFRANRDRAGEAYALGNLALVDTRRGDLDTAADRLRQALALAREIGDRATEAYSLDDLGVVLRGQGLLTEAVRLHQESVALCRAIGELPGEAKAHNGLGETRHAAGDEGAAEQEHTTALALAGRIGDRYEQARAHGGLARCLHDDTRADEHAREALALYTGLEVPEAESFRAESATLARGRRG